MLLSLLSPTVLAIDEVRHTVSFPENKEQVFLVRSEFPVSSTVTELIMPDWTPGSYLIRDHAANVNRISATTEDGTGLTLQKTSKDRWQVDTSTTGTLIVDYEVFTPVLNVSTSWASKAFSLINGASVFLYTTQTRDFRQSVKFAYDQSRGEPFTAMLPAPGGGFQAADFDQLVDDPVAIARAPVYRFTNNAQDYNLVNVGENRFWDGNQAAQDVEKVVAETQSFWGTNPLQKPYWFLNFIVEAKGGLEHDHSTVMMTGRRHMRDRKAYIKWLGLVAHEFFHVWNVRNMRPLELEHYDYQNEQYTSQLWIAEGLTSYYDNLIMSRAGLITPKEYLELLAQDIYRLETTPGRLLRPVTEASVDAWIRHYKPNANTYNSTISYYTKGAVIGFVLDSYLRKSSKGRHTLDDVMRKMYARYSNKAYSADAFEKVVIDVGGAGAGEFLQPLLTTTVEPDVDAALEFYGLELNRGAIMITGEPDEEPLLSDIGVHWNNNKPGLVVKTVVGGSAGETAGLISGDEILAIGDERLTRKNIDKVMTSFSPGDQVSLLVSRRGKITSLDITLDVAIPDRYEILLKSGFTKRDLARLKRLLGQDLNQ
ncbi:MAG: PDZ domain-containing protein [Lysobacterales bacterium]